MASPPPSIFSASRRQARRARAWEMLDQRETAMFLIDEMTGDIHERLAFLRHEPARVLVEGFDGGGVAGGPWINEPIIESTSAQDFDAPVNFLSGSFDLVTSVNSVDKVNDLPGALIQMRELLAPGGLAIASFVGGSSLPVLRRIMYEADGERPAARLHPMVDPRSCTQLLGRAGWQKPVVDSHVFKVRYRSLSRLVQDLREQALGNVLASPAPPLSRAALARAHAAFADLADEDGRVTEHFEVITLTGWR